MTQRHEGKHSFHKVTPFSRQGFGMRLVKHELICAQMRSDILCSKGELSWQCARLFRFCLSIRESTQKKTVRKGSMWVDRR
jgi:hypothetical protein